jgi:hypothetical protein
VSSANNIGSEREFILRGRSFMYIKNNKDPRIEPWELLVSLYPSERKKYEMH